MAARHAGRNLLHLLQTITDFEDKVVGFRSLIEAIDTTTADGKFVFNIFGGLAGARDLIRERTSAGLLAARART